MYPFFKSKTWLLVSFILLKALLYFCKNIFFKTVFFLLIDTSWQKNIYYHKQYNVTFYHCVCQNITCITNPVLNCGHTGSWLSQENKHLLKISLRTLFYMHIAKDKWGCWLEYTLMALFQIHFVWLHWVIAHNKKHVWVGWGTTQPCQEGQTQSVLGEEPIMKAAVPHPRVIVGCS